jgi:hypothetical protein
LIQTQLNKHDITYHANKSPKKEKKKKKKTPKAEKMRKSQAKRKTHATQNTTHINTHNTPSYLISAATYWLSLSVLVLRPCRFLITE